MSYELHFTYTAPARLGTGKTLKKPKGSEGSILKKTQNPTKKTY